MLAQDIFSWLRPSGVHSSTTIKMAGLDRLKLSLSQSSRAVDRTDDGMGPHGYRSSHGQETGLTDTSSKRSDDGYDSLRTVFKTVSLASRKRMEMGLGGLINYLENSRSQDLLRYNIVAIFSISLEDRDIAIKAGIVYGAIYTMTIGQDTVQSILVEEIEKELEKNGFGNGNRERFSNAVFLLSEIYFHIGQRPENEPISILANELLNCFHWLLSGVEEELEILATCLILNGSSLKQENTTTYVRLLVDIRKTLLRRNISGIGRCLMLLIIDMDNINFSTLPEDLMIFYMTHIGDQRFPRLERMKWSPKSSSGGMTRTTSTGDETLKEQLPTRTRHTEHRQSGNRRKPSMQLYAPPPMRQQSPGIQPDPSRPSEANESQAMDTLMMQNPECNSDNLKDCSGDSYNIPSQKLNENDGQDDDDLKEELLDLDEELAMVGLNAILEEDDAVPEEDGKENWYSENDE